VSSFFFTFHAFRSFFSLFFPQGKSALVSLPTAEEILGAVALDANVLIVTQTMAILVQCSELLA
jgi:hypothetical protein